MKKSSDIRRENLDIAIDRAGSAAKLASAAGVSEAYLSQIKTCAPESKTKKPKSMGNVVARKIEIAIKEPEGWMDADHAPVLKSANDSPMQDAASLAELISLWWESDEEGKLFILDSAKRAVGLQRKRAAIEHN